MRQAAATYGELGSLSRLTRRRALAMVGAGYAMTTMLGAQPAGKTAYVGFLGPVVPDAQGRELFNMLRSEMERLGWAEGSHIEYVLRLPGGFVNRDLASTRTAALAQELVAARVGLIIAMSTPCARAAKSATATIPIVFLAEDPVETGLVASLARPTGNATGVTYHIDSLLAKRTQLLTQAVGGIRRIAFLGPDGTLYHTAQTAGKALNVELILVRVERAEEIESAFSSAPEVDAWMIEDYSTFVPHIARIVELVAKAKKPAIYGDKEYVLAGGLMSYTDDRENWPRHVASFVDRILRGAKPAELPVLEPARFLLAINQKAAHSLGINIASSVMLQADEVIE